MQLGEGITVNGSFEQDGVGITVRVSVAQLRVWYILSVNVCKYMALKKWLSLFGSYILVMIQLSSSVLNKVWVLVKSLQQQEQQQV